MGDLLNKYDGSKDSPAPLKPEAKVFDRLRNAILSGILPPHNLLANEIGDLAERVGTDKATIREALIRLAADGLVEQNGDDFTIVSLSLHDLREIYFLRGILESTAGKLACGHLTADDLDSLEQICRQMETGLQNNEIAKISRLNSTFHQTIYRAANSPRLYKMIAQLWNGFLHSTLSFLTLRAPASVSEHRAILEALKAKDEEKVETIIKEHLISAQAALEEYWSSHLEL